MKLDYNILWVDDRIEERPFQRILESTKEYLINENFNCQIISAKEYNEFIERYKSQNEFDLIITDYTLNNGTLGNQVIDYVRDNEHNNTEVFFYSAQTDINDIKLFSNSRITFFQLTEGDYKELEHEIFDVIHQTIKKFQHIIAMRGMIMNETSSLDIEFTEILENIITSDENALKKIRDRYKKFNSDNIEKADDLLLNELLYKIGASHRWKGLKENIAKDDFHQILLDYEKDIIITRNKFAHAILQEDETGRKYFKDKQDGIDFNDDACKIIRQNILKHKSNLTNLRSTYCSKKEN
ncbi:MAG: hypothetical protein RJA76_429 [Bacteroidota bacterium]|jgi:CheY-like chemotaxis protein